MTHIEHVLRLASTSPDAPILSQGDRTLSVAELVASARGRAAALAASGVERGDRVVLWLAPGPELAVSLVACWILGAIVVLVDPGAHADTYHHVASTVRPVVVLRSEATPTPDALGFERDVADLPDETLHWLPRAPLPTEPASILFTSGSTGMPKGVVQSHGNLYRGAGAVGRSMSLQADDCLLCPVPWTFDYGFLNLQLSLRFGAHHVVPEASGGPFGIAKAIERFEPTVFAGVPAVLPFALPALEGAGGQRLRALSNTGGAIPRKVLDRMVEGLPRTEIYLNYGLTESYRSACLEPSRVATHAHSVGRGIEGVDIVVVDADGRPVPAGVEGEIVHRGDYLFMGYWGLPEATRARLRPDPLVPPGTPAPQVLFTGDLGVLDDDGRLTFRGRRDRQLKSMGVRVSPDEVERMMRHCELVEDIAVVGRKHESLGHEVCAAVVVPEGTVDARARLVAYARTLPPHAAPRRWRIVDALPRTHTKKVDYPLVDRWMEET